MDTKNQLRQTGNLQNLNQPEVQPETENIDTNAVAVKLKPVNGNCYQPVNNNNTMTSNYDKPSAPAERESSSARGSLSSQISTESVQSATSIFSNTFAKGWNASAPKPSAPSSFKSVRAPQGKRLKFNKFLLKITANNINKLEAES